MYVCVYVSAYLNRFTIYMKIKHYQKRYKYTYICIYVLRCICVYINLFTPRWSDSKTR